MTAEPFSDRLMSAIETKDSRLCVGLDPHLDRLPVSAWKKAGLEGVPEELDRSRAARAVVEFFAGLIPAVSEYTPCVKPQAAFFERLGAPGWEAYEEILKICRAEELLVIIDAKRGDIGSTAKAYAAYHLEDAGTSGDALTVNPYLGFEAMKPFLSACGSHGKGVFVLVKTSNPGGGEFQDLNRVDGGNLFEAVADATEAYSASRLGRYGYGPAGAVVGATYPRQLAELRARMPHVPLLVPGFGAQGGTAADVVPAFDSNALGAVVNSSRGILFAFGNPGCAGDENFASLAGEAAKSARDAINQALDSKR